MSKNYLTKENIILIANGEFPTHKKPLEIIKKNKYIICCDGAANSLIKFGQNPNIVIGDLDSIDPNTAYSLIEKVIDIKDQNNNDFRKALHWISENINLHKLFILGATGLREDHTLGNLTTFLYQKFNFNIEKIKSDFDSLVPSRLTRTNTSSISDGFLRSFAVEGLFSSRVEYFNICSFS